MRVRAALSTLALGMAFASPAAAWNATGAVWNGDLEWWINSNGSASSQYTNIAVVESTLQIGYDQWESPSCSNFVSDYQGRTSRNSTSNGDGFNVMGFPQVWPSNYGDRWGTIGITVGYTQGSSYAETDISFNEQTWTFINGSPANNTYQADLLSIAVHESGHSLGLAHSGSGGSSMTAGYSGGTAERSLANDDITGVCALYPGNGNPPGPTDDDGYEPNDDQGDAVTLQCGDTIEAVALDRDWYRVRSSTTGEVRVIISWTTTADLDLYLLSTEGELDRAENSGGSPEIVFAENQPPGLYYALVIPYEGETEYLMTLLCDQGLPGDDDDAGDDDAADDDAGDDDDAGPGDDGGTITDGEQQDLMGEASACSGCSSGANVGGASAALLLAALVCTRRRRGAPSLSVR
jgi:hypothetical protein